MQLFLVLSVARVWEETMQAVLVRGLAIIIGAGMAKALCQVVFAWLTSYL